MFKFCSALVVLFMLFGCSEAPEFSYVYRDGKSVNDFEVLVQERGVERPELAKSFNATWHGVFVEMTIESIVNLYGEPDIHVLTKYQAGGLEFDSVVFFYAVRINRVGNYSEEEQWVRFHFDGEGKLFWAVPSNMYYLSTVGDKDLSRGMYWIYR